MLDRELLSAAVRERLRGAARVLDLPPIHLARREPRDELRLRVHARRGRRDAGLAEEGAPDLGARGEGELAEVERDVDAREEGGVERGDAVRGEEEDAAIVLDVPKARRRR